MVAEAYPNETLLIQYFPVVEDGKLVGVVTLMDCWPFLDEKDLMENDD